MTAITQTLADFVTGTGYDDLPKQVVEKVKRLLLDSVACALGGYVVDRSRIAMELVADLGGKPQATIIGNGKTSYNLAAFANGELINALDYDASGPLTPHVAPYVIPPSLAMGERVKASGKDLITALALGHEIGGRVVNSLSQRTIPKDEPPYYEWAPRFSYTSTVFGAVAGAGNLLHLSSGQVANAFGIAGASTPVPAGLKWQETSGPAIMVKFNCWSGWIAQLATTAVLAAEKGFTGDTTILDGEWGFWKIYGSPFFKVDNLLGKLGEVWHVGAVETFKMYPVCKINHTTIEGINQIMLENDINPDEIEEILVKGDPMMVTPNRSQTEIKSFADTQFCSAFVTALAVYHGRSPGPSWQLPATFNDPRIVELMKKVRFEILPETLEASMNTARAGGIKSYFGIVVEITVGGRKLVAEVTESKGSPSKPLTDDEFISKFKDNASYSALRSDKVEQAIDMILELEEVDDVTKLMALLSV